MSVQRGSTTPLAGLFSVEDVFQFCSVCKANACRSYQDEDKLPGAFCPRTIAKLLPIGEYEDEVG